ncbi:universal stress protein [Halobellus limi]|uniref:Universal stress protein n=1 Tax=Halobellus limi TaxID=699433 RepID=A0A1H6CQV7_9EURY|nr:universal stress protein [Halobellus limi]QCC49073.1 universal stress protein [Halobellus limi]SEG75361.1 Nucleotide-binding universal stress protein, UspA family [Halobellus limi]
MVIVAAVDRSDQASAVLEEAETLAQRFDDVVHVLHVMERSEAIQGAEDGNERLPNLQDRAAAVASELIEEHRLSTDVDAVGRIGDPANKIVEYADAEDARYVVVSPQQRSKTGKVLFGSVAQSVLLNAHCPVVSLRARSLDQ